MVTMTSISVEDGVHAYTLLLLLLRAWGVGGDGGSGGGDCTDKGHRIDGRGGGHDNDGTNAGEKAWRAAALANCERRGRRPSNAKRLLDTTANGDSAPSAVLEVADAAVINDKAPLPL